MRNNLGWEPRIKFDELVKIMMDADLRDVGLEPPGEGTKILATKGMDWFKEYPKASAEEETMARDGAFR